MTIERYESIHDKFHDIEVTETSPGVATCIMFGKSVELEWSPNKRSVFVNADNCIHAALSLSDALKWAHFELVGVVEGPVTVELDGKTYLFEESETEKGARTCRGVTLKEMCPGYWFANAGGMGGGEGDSPKGAISRLFDDLEQSIKHYENGLKKYQDILSTFLQD